MDSNIDALQQLDILRFIVRNIITGSFECHGTCGNEKVFGGLVLIEEIIEFLVFILRDRQTVKDTLVKGDIRFFIIARSLAFGSGRFKTDKQMQ